MKRTLILVLMLILTVFFSSPASASAGDVLDKIDAFCIARCEDLPAGTMFLDREECIETCGAKQFNSWMSSAAAYQASDCFEKPEQEICVVLLDAVKEWTYKGLTNWEMVYYTYLENMKTRVEGGHK